MARATFPQARTGRTVAIAGLVVSAFLASINIVVGLVTHSTSVLATGLEFAGDILASAVVLVGMIVAVKPADRNHPYGHGRIETLAAFLVGLILAAGGAGICWTALRAVGARHAPPGVAAVVVLLVAIALRAAMSALKFRVGRRIGSAALLADAWNDTVDILGAGVALIAVVLTRLDARFLAADHYGGFVVGIIVILTGLRVLRNASLQLVDTMPHAELIDSIRTAALEVPGVLGVEKVLARKTGFGYHVDLHIEVDGALTVAAGHVIGGRTRALLRERFDRVTDVLIHVEPAPEEIAARVPSGDGRGPDHR